MIIELLNLNHQRELRNRFKKMSLSISEYSFANLYLFRILHQYTVINLNEEIFIKGISRDQMPFIMPTKFPSPEYLKTLYLLQDKLGISLLYPIPQEHLPYYKTTFRAEFNEGESDYLYSRAKLAAYPGRHLSKKRNLSKQFLTTHQGQNEPLSINNLNEAKKILENWSSELSGIKEMTDYSSCLEAIENFSLLNLEGRIIYADHQQPAGFILGEWLNQECFAVHFQKALKTFHGSYQYLLQNTAIFLENPSCWINLEQDLGISALRLAKHSYLPDKIILKWRLFNQ